MSPVSHRATLWVVRRNSPLNELAQIRRRERSHEHRRQPEGHDGQGLVEARTQRRRGSGIALARALVPSMTNSIARSVRQPRCSRSSSKAGYARQVLGGPLVEAENVLCAALVDAHGDEHQMFADVDAVDHHRADRKLAEAATHHLRESFARGRHGALARGALARAPRGYAWRGRLYRPVVLARRHTEDHLLTARGVSGPAWANRSQVSKGGSLPPPARTRGRRTRTRRPPSGSSPSAWPLRVEVRHGE